MAVRHDLTIFLAIALTCVAIAGAGVLTKAYFAQAANPAESRVLLQQDPPGIARPMSLLDAWRVADAYGHSWQTDAAIARIGSVDILDPSPDQAGLDGRRRVWSAALVSSSAPKLELWVRVADGVVVHALEQSTGGELVAIQQKPAIDSDEAVRLVRSARPDFTPGSIRARGVHFVVELVPGSATPTFAVLGQFGDSPAAVEIDALTGAGIKAARELTYGKSGGILYSADAGLTWSASSLTGQFVTSIAPHPTQADSAFAAVAESSAISIYRTGDGGASWIPVGRLPAAAGNWPFGILAVRGMQAPTTVLVGTRNGLWVSTDDGTTWAAVAGLPPGPVQWLAREYGFGAPRVIATISAGPAVGVYSTTDLHVWTKEGDSPARLSEPLGATAVVALDEGQLGVGRLFQASQPGHLQLPPGALRVAGTLDGTAPILAESPTDLRISRDGGSTWVRTLETGLASVAVAPDFATSGVALAGGFRTGVYRTTDGGQHWTRVLADPSRIVPGNNEIATVAFLSPKRVLAANGGALQWQDH